MRLSIVTINLNNKEGLEKTLKSVFEQTYEEFEYIVIDGGSTDGSKDLIVEHSSRIDYWVSEKDSGIYNAMNKGIRASSGEYLLFLNSGDYFIDCSVVLNVINELDETDIVQGNIIEFENGKPKRDKGYGKSEIDFLDVFKGHFLHQASLIKRELFEKYGFYDESYKINGDTVFYANALGFGTATFKYVDIDIAYFDTTGISSDPKGEYTKLRQEEDSRYFHETYPTRLYDFMILSQKSVSLYQELHQSQIIWKLAMFLKKISQVINKK